MCDDLCKDGDAAINTPRRNLFRQAGALAAVAGLGGLGLLTPQAAMATPLTRESREALGIEGVLQRLKQGNERFQAGQATQHDYLAQKRAQGVGCAPGQPCRGFPGPMEVRRAWPGAATAGRAPWDSRRPAQPGYSERLMVKLPKTGASRWPLNSRVLW